MKWTLNNKPKYTGGYIVHSNVGVHGAWYDNKLDTWRPDKELDQESTLIFEVYKYMRWPKP